MKINFTNLNIWLKLAVIGGWVAFVIYTISFIYGVVEALLIA